MIILHGRNELPGLIKNAFFSELFSLKLEIELSVLLGDGTWGGAFKDNLRNVDESNSTHPEAFTSLLCTRHCLCYITFSSRISSLLTFAMSAHRA